MPSLKNNYVEVRFKTTQEIRERLAHHAQRIGADMNDIVRHGTMEYLDRLDEQEAVLQERKKAKRAKLVPEHPWGKPKGLGESKGNTISFKLPTLSFLTNENAVTVPEKITKSFRRWAEYIEDAEDRSDGERRAETVLKDMYEKCTNEQEKQLAFDAFKEFMDERKASKEKAETVVDIGDVPIDGDA